MQLSYNAWNQHWPEGILKLLSNLKPDKAPGLDGIRPIILKELRGEIAPVIQPLFQKS